jgi:Na+-transporting methylmalonyl-CoA/oxaloacetate decarboxylase gamma subunit
MIEWSKVAEGWAGFGVTILVLIILAVLAWIIGLVIQKVQARGEEVPEKKEE